MLFRSMKITLVAFGALSGPITAQEATRASHDVGEDTTVAIYTLAQADVGERSAQEKCVACHTVDEWTGQAFLNIWAGRPLKELYDRIKNEMPPDLPGSLTPEQYLGIVAYILELSGAPAGETPLPSADTRLGEVVFPIPSYR